MSRLEVVYRRFFQFWLIFQTKIINNAQKNIISTDADIAHFLWRRKDSLSSKFAHHIRNNNKGPQLLEDTAD